MKDSCVLSVVIPAYNEALNLEAVITEVIRVVSPLCSFEVIVVDDGSCDNSWDVIETLAARWLEIRAFRLSRNFGKESAIAAGLSYSQGKVVVLIDADLQHPPATIFEMLQLWSEDGYDVVNAVKRQRQPESIFKSLITKFYFLLFSKLVGFDLNKASDYKLLDRRAVDTVLSMPERHTFFRGLVPWIGFKQTNIVFDVDERQSGVTTWSLRRLMMLAMDSIVAFTTLPMHLITLVGALFGILASVLAIQTFALWLSGNAVPGFTTVILLLIFVGAVLMLGLGIIGAYVAKIYEEVKHRPRFLVQKVIEKGVLINDSGSDTDQMDRTLPALKRSRLSEPTSQHLGE